MLAERAMGGLSYIAQVITDSETIGVTDFQEAPLGQKASPLNNRDIVEVP